MRGRKMRECCVQSPGSPTHDHTSEPMPSEAQAPHTCKGPWHMDSKVRTGARTAPPTLLWPAWWFHSWALMVQEEDGLHDTGA